MISVSSGAAQDALESLPELRTEHCVDDRIQRRIEVAQPQEERNHRVADITIVAQRHHQRHDEERQPADDKCTGDYGQGFGRLSLPLCLERLFAPRDLRVRIVRRLFGQGQCRLLLRLLNARRDVTYH